MIKKVKVEQLTGQNKSEELNDQILLWFYHQIYGNQNNVHKHSYTKDKVRKNILKLYLPKTLTIAISML